MKRLTITDLEVFKGVKIWENKRSHNQQSVGAMAFSNVSQTFYLYSLDDFDSKYFADTKLGKNEKLFRYETRTSAIGGYFPVIKINVKSGLVYFNESEEDTLKFGRVSEKPVWININSKAV